MLNYHIDEKGLNPELFENVCEFIIRNHISVIEVKIGAKSVIKSVRDVKITFENQLSAIGIVVILCVTSKQMYYGQSHAGVSDFMMNF